MEGFPADCRRRKKKKRATAFPVCHFKMAADAQPFAELF
jgi:hypothetical protein